MMASAGARRGEIFPGFMLSMPDGSPVELERYRGRNNLILIFAGNVLGRAGPTSPLLEELVALSAELAAEVAQVLVVVASRSAVASQGDPGPFPILVDSDAHIHRRVGATDAAGQPAPALFVTDRFREIYATYVSAEGSALPSAKEVMDWLRFINIQCPECGVPEWPV
jgi:peroxiredoxin